MNEYAVLLIYERTALEDLELADAVGSRMRARQGAPEYDVIQ